MINFHTITLEAHHLYDPFTGSHNSHICHNLREVLLDKYGEVRTILFQEGDSADVQLTDGSRFLMLFEQGCWQCCIFEPSRFGMNGIDPAKELVTLYGPYDDLEEALRDLLSKRNYLTSVN